MRNQILANSRSNNFKVVCIHVHWWPLFWEVNAQWYFEFCLERARRKKKRNYTY